MSNTQTNIPSPPPRPKPSDVLWKLSWSFFGFSVVFSVILALSWTYLLPRYTKIEVNGKLMDPSVLQQQEKDLKNEIAGYEQKRLSLVTAVHDPAYRALTEQRSVRRPLKYWQQEFRDFASKAVGSGSMVHVGKWEYDSEAKTLTVTGDVRNAGVSSMTALAQLAAAMQSAPFAKSSTTPAFSRMQDKNIGYYSPFVFTFALK